MLHHNKLHEHISCKQDTESRIKKVQESKFPSFIHKPGYLAILIISAIFITEFSVMTLMHYIPDLSSPIESFIDATLLTIMLIPILYFFLYRPFQLNIKARDKALRSRDKEAKEWDKTMNCVADMIAILDVDKKIRKANKAMCDFATSSKHNVIGMPWIAFVYDLHLDISPNAFESRILFHEPTNKWFEMNFYNHTNEFEDLEEKIVSFHDITELKHTAEELEATYVEVAGSKKNLQFALNEITRLLDIATKNPDTKIRLNNPHLEKCYKVNNCEMEDCSCYGKGALRCWQIVGTYCGGEIQGAFTEKCGNCVKCEVFQKATTNPIYGIAEQFNNMMQVIAIKHRELKNSHVELRHVQSQMIESEKMATLEQRPADEALDSSPSST